MPEGLGFYVGLSKVNRDDIHHVSKNLAKIEKQLAKWTASGGGLAVLRPSDIKERWAERRKEMERLRNQAEESRDNPSEESGDDGA